MKGIAASLICVSLLVVLVSACELDTRPEAAIIGELSSRRAETLKSKLNTFPHSGGTHHLIVQGSKMSTLSDSEKQAIVASYLENYRIVILDVSEAHLDIFRTLIEDKAGISHHAPQVIDAVVVQRDPEIGLPVTSFYIDATTKAPSQPDDPVSTLDPDAVEDELLANGIVEELAASRAMTSFIGPQEILQLAQSASPSFPWTANVTNYLKSFAGGGSFTTNFQIWGVRQCQTGAASYVAIATDNWAPGTQYEYAVVAENDTQGRIHWYDKTDSQLQKVVSWHTATNAELQDGGAAPASCGTGGKGAYQNTACQIVNYPGFYTVTMNPTGSSLANVTQINTAPAQSQGPATTQTSGFNFTIGGNLGGSPAGPTGSIAASATWTSSTSVSVGSTQIYKTNLSSYTPNSGTPTNFATTTGQPTGVGAGWTVQYCVQPTKEGQCGLPYVGIESHLSCDEKLGLPVAGQLSNASFSSFQEMAYWTDSTPPSSAPSTFPITVSFESALQTTTLLVWNKLSNSNGPPFGGDCDDGEVSGTHCSCVPTTTDSSPVVLSYTYNVPVPPECPPPVLTMNKVIVNSTGANTPSQWTLTADNTASSSIDLSGATGVTGSISAGNYTLTETGPSGYSLQVLCADKTRGPVAANTDGTFTFLNGDILTCTFYNTVS